MDSGSFVCIADANIFIDFSDLQYIGISIVSLDGKRMLRLSELRIDFQKPSIADLSALVAAEHLNTILLTGDAALRRAAAGIGVEVHGTISCKSRHYPGLKPSSFSIKCATAVGDFRPILKVRFLN